MGHRDGVALRSRRESAGDGDRALDRHVRHIGVLSGCGDLTEDEERAVGLETLVGGFAEAAGVEGFPGGLQLSRVKHLTINWLEKEPHAICLKITTVMEIPPPVVVAQKPRNKKVVKSRMIPEPQRLSHLSCAQG